MRWPFDHEDLKRELKYDSDKELALYLGYKDGAYMRYTFKAGKYGMKQMKRHSSKIPGGVIIGEHRKIVSLKELGEMLRDHSKTKVAEKTGIISQNFYGIQRRLLNGGNVRVHVVEAICKYFKVSVRV